MSLSKLGLGIVELFTYLLESLATFVFTLHPFLGLLQLGEQIFIVLLEHLNLITGYRI